MESGSSREDCAARGRVGDAGRMGNRMAHPPVTDVDAEASKEVRAAH